MNDIEKQLQAARQSLLDLSLRNRLLNFRPTKARTLRIIEEFPRDVYSSLVLKEKSLEFLPRPENTEQKEELSVERVEKNEAINSEEESVEEEEWDFPLFQAENPNRHSERYVQTAIESSQLHKRLSHINQQGRSFVEEQGYTILYLALGFLEWKDKQDPESTRAPLILIPVELERSKIKDPFKMKWTGEEIVGNISLQEKLIEQQIQLPDFEMIYDKDGVDRYFQSILAACEKKAEWRVLNGIYLDFFSFTKFVMYKDLEPAAWPEGKSPAEHPLIRSILYPNADAQVEQGFSEENVDKELNSQDLYHIMDADSSQISVIEDVKAGKSLVVEGPPGTGKSQTITNIIAELLAKGKSVLFMSEKMAALEVVKNRLDQVGLGNFCLELHSRKTKKKEFLEELKRSIYGPVPPEVSIQEKCDALETLKIDLNFYAQVLREPFQHFGRSPFELFCMKENAIRHFGTMGRNMPRFKFLDLKKCDHKEWASMIERFANMAKALPTVKPLTRHPWRGCEPGTVLPADKEEIGTLIEKAIKVMEELETATNRLTKLCAVKQPVNYLELQQVISFVKEIASSNPLDRNVFLNAQWNEPNEDAEKLIQKIEQFQNKITKFSSKALEQDVASIYDEYKELSKKLLRVFDSRYRYLNKEIIGLYKNLPPREVHRVVSDLERLIECLKMRDEIRENKKVGEAFFGALWKAEKSEPGKLQDFGEKMIAFRQELIQHVLRGTPTDEMLCSGGKWTQVQQTVEQLERVSKKFLQIRRQLAKRIGLDFQIVFGVEPAEVPFFELASRYRLWSSELDRLQQWGQFVALRNECGKTKAQPFLENIQNDAVEPEDVVEGVKGNFADEVLRMAFLEKPELSKFIGELHEDKIRRFMELDCEIIKLNRKRLVHKLFQNRPRISGGASPGSEAGILLGEFNRKRRHMPIRKLVSLTGGLIQKIKPCFMMSPLSIAKFLDPHTVRFDVIVFDEASQVKPEDAFGALLRGKQLVVMGDTCQLPPTSFFENIVEAEEMDGDEEAALIDMESILHQCKRSFPTKTLRWHYRSKHESLIAISNREFYNNQLFVYPSPLAKSPMLGLKLVHLPDTIYDRGKTSTNRREAKAVAKAAIEHYRLNPQKSLGIGAFNVKQQEVLLDEVEKQIRLNPEMEDFFRSDRKEHFFVKNLETIQGDERDVIFVSIGFGFNEAKRLSLNFGPLNQNGGERRLNVLISRAREKFVVFSNFKASDLILDANSPMGLKAFKKFLYYAEHGILSEDEEEQSKEKGNLFEEAIYDLLKKHNNKVKKRVGCAGFRVDFAILDPHSSGRYLLGIECDGPKYHLSPVARDRDRLRQQILENLGWRLYRVWSTDWYCNRSETENMLLQAVKKTKREASQNLLPHSGIVENPNQDKLETKDVEIISDENTALHNVPVLDTKDLIRIAHENKEIEDEPIQPFASEASKASQVEDTIQEPTIISKKESNIEEITELDEPSEVEETYYSMEELDSSDLYYGEDSFSTTDTFYVDSALEKDFLKKEETKKEESKKEETKKDTTNNITPLTQQESTFEENSSSEENEESSIPHYQVCESLGIPIEGKLQNAEIEKLVVAINNVVEVEGPVHFNEVLRRIRTIWGVKRAGPKIQDLIGNAMKVAEEEQHIRSQEDFLWPFHEEKAPVRKRAGDTPIKIELICDEEIAEAVQFVLRKQYATMLKDLVIQTSRILGFQGTHRKTSIRIEKIITQLIEDGVLQENSNEMIDFSVPE